MIALRVGEVTANAADCTPTSTSSSAMLRRPASACTSRASVTIQVSADAHSSSRRRSTASATAPPYRPKTISGTSPTRPSMPTQNEDRLTS